MLVNQCQNIWSNGGNWKSPPWLPVRSELKVFWKSSRIELIRNIFLLASCWFFIFTAHPDSLSHWRWENDILCKFLIEPWYHISVCQDGHFVFFSQINDWCDWTELSLSLPGQADDTISSKYLMNSGAVLGLMSDVYPVVSSQLRQHWLDNIVTWCCLGPGTWDHPSPSPTVLAWLGVNHYN